MPLNLPEGRVQLACVAAHPDDLEIGAGGFLLSLGQSREVVASCLTMTGDAQRMEEASKAAAAFLPGSTIDFAGYPDGYLPAFWSEVKRRMHRFAADGPEPDIVLVPWSGDAHQDHRLIGEIAPTVWRNSLILHYEIPKWDGDVGRPNLYVPVADAIAERKRTLLDECYPSQRDRDWWDDEVFFGFMRLRGMECRNRYAEAFHLPKSTLDLN